MSDLISDVLTKSNYTPSSSKRAGIGSSGEISLHRIRIDRISKIHLSRVGFKPLSAYIDRREGITGASRKAVKEHAGLSRRRGVVWVFIALLIGSSLAFAFVISPAVQKTQVTYIPHPVIGIDGTEELDTQATDEGWQGEGTEANPYLITGWEVSALGSYAGIYVGNTSSHFAISECYVHDAAAACILLFNVTNATVQGNICENSQQGIDVVSSESVEVIDNTCTMAFNGIRVVSSDKCNLTENNCTGNLVGLAAHDSENIRFELNNLSYNAVSGMHLNRTNRSSAVNNTCSGNQYGTYMADCSFVYLNSTEWGDNRDGGLWMYHCHDVSASGNRARNSHDGPGLRMDDSGRCTLSGNRVEGCGEGIRCTGSDDCDLRDNHCSGNYGDGIRAEGSGRCWIRDNECSDNGGHGVSTGMCSDGWVERNTCTRNGGGGVSCSDGLRCDVRDNLCTGNDGAEVRGHSLNYCNVTGNIVNASAGDGIAIEESTQVNVSDNLCSESITGIRISTSSDCAVYNNTVLDCAFGIEVSGSLGMVLRENTMTDDGLIIAGVVHQYWNSHEIGPTNLVNGLPVLYLVSAVGVEVFGAPGQIILVECTDVMIDGLDLSNASVGVAAAFSERVTISNCTSSDGQIGVYGYSSSSIVVRNTTCNRNGDSGVLLDFCQMCDLLESTFKDNNEFGVNLGMSPGCEVMMCEISGSGSGIGTDTPLDAGILTGNVISDCTSGIAALSSSGMEAHSNMITDCSYGVLLLGSMNSVMTGNSMTGCGLYIDSDFLGGWNTHLIDVTNSVNGGPLLYLADVTGIAIPSDAGQVTLANCSWINVVSMNLSDCTAGVLAGFSDNVSVVDCVMSGNHVGVGLTLTADSHVLSNTIVGCDSEGVRLAGAERNTVADNTVTDCGTGIGMHYGLDGGSTYNQILFNDISESTYGVYVDESPDNLIENNTFESSIACGVMVNMSDRTTISNSLCTGSGDMAISISGSAECTVANNTCSMNVRGIYLWSSDDCNLTGNTLLGNAEYGVCLDSSCTGNSVWDNVFAYNNGSFEDYDPLHVQACDDGDNSWNTSELPSGAGNYWHDWTAPDFNGDDIVDEPYSITGDAGSKDYYPKAVTSTPIEPIPEFSALAALGLLAVVILFISRRKRD